ncbi:hypothetical protein [Duncaniella dubosii]
MPLKQTKTAESGGAFKSGIAPLRKSMPDRMGATTDGFSEGRTPQWPILK